MQSILNQKKPLRLAAAAALLTFAAGTAAHDIELFTVPPEGVATAPNVLFIVDNSANWTASLGHTTKETLEKEALTEVLVRDESLQGSMRVGLMSFADSNNPRGGKILAAIQDITADYQRKLDGIINPPNNPSGPALVKGNNAPYAMAFHEAYLYFRGAKAAAGVADNKGTYDASALSGNNYISPAAAYECSKNFIVLIGNGEPDNGENKDAEDALRGLGGRLPGDPIRVTPDDFQTNWADEYARFLRTSNFTSSEARQNVITYVIDVHNPDSNQADTKKFIGARAWLKSIGSQGGGGYFAVSSKEELIDALKKINEEIQAVNSVFSSVTLPVSINVRGTNLNQVYMGVFRPDGSKRPQWRGNLKLYQMGRDANTGEVYLADAAGNRADSSATGFIRNTAVSFWTHDSDYWEFAPQGDTPTPGSDKPDGDIVEKGGAAQMLRENYVTRQLLMSQGDSLTSFGNATAAQLGVSSDTERTALIEWVRGKQNVDTASDDGPLDGPRASIHGDVLHSRPAVVTYGHENDIVVFYGSNDGVFRAVRGGTSSVSSGHELWGLVLEEHLDQLKTLRDNEVLDAISDKPYFVDGSISVLRKSANNVKLFLSMRRGGDFLYALDVSDPEDPKFLWRRSSQDWPELGQTWSEPQVAKIRFGEAIKDVLIFGAGYDADVNDASPAGGEASKGRGIMVVDANSGELLWDVGPNPSSGRGKVRHDMKYSIPSDITILNRDGDADGLADRLYVGDTGGNVWRVDINAPDPHEWTVHKLAELGAGQKFLYPPDVVYAEGYDAILIGSGDREHPFDTSVQNAFYMLKDTRTSAVIAAEGSVPTLSRADGDLHDATAEVTASTMPASSRGWFFDLGPGEKAIGGAVTLAGATYFATNQPAPPTSCAANLGIARIYAVNYRNAVAARPGHELRSVEIPGGGLLPSPVPLIVEFDDPSDEGKIKDIGICFGPNCENPPQVTLDRRIRSFWYRKDSD